jgi:hypothetical protein
LIRGASDRAIRPAQVDPPRRAEHRSRRLCFREPLLDGAIAAHLAGGEIAEPHAIALLHVARDRSAEPDLEVVRVRAEDEEVDGVHPGR